MQFPWQPIYSIERSGLPEVTISGIVSVVDRQGRDLLALGDIHQQIWTRSCLKPLQLLGHYDVLKIAYPGLERRHLAIMESSHSGEDYHMDCLREIMAIGQVDDSLLQCTPSHSWHTETQVSQIAAGEPQQPIYNSCSGKHFGFLMAMKAQRLDLAHYLGPSGQQFVQLKRIIRVLFDRQSENLPYAIDGCRLPNFSLSGKELALLYCWLSTGVPAAVAERGREAGVQEKLAALPEMASLMREFPELIGGSGRLDTKLMRGTLTPAQKLDIVAKEGAEGIIVAGISPTPRYPDGLGILVKIASGYELGQMQNVICSVLEQLGLRAPDAVAPENAHLQKKVHFSVAATT